VGRDLTSPKLCTTAVRIGQIDAASCFTRPGNGLDMGT
jgi:hypothetical protein